MLNSHPSQISVKHAVVNMKWANALDQDSVTLCTWNQSHVSWDVICIHVVVDVAVRDLHHRQEGDQDHHHQREVEEEVEMEVVDVETLAKEITVVEIDEDAIKLWIFCF